MKNTKFKDVLASHFDDDMSEKSDNINIEGYSSIVNDEYLRTPYKYIEDVYLKNIEDKKILDYCCGAGVYSILPALSKATIFGIDISEKSIEVARKKADVLNISNQCFFSVGDAENLNFEDNFFDMILSYGSLSYLDLDKSFKELRRVLKPEGMIIIVDSLGYNPIFRINRRKNIKNYASNYVDQLKTPTHKDLNISLNYFNSYSIKYFDLFSLIGSLLNKKFGIRIDPSKLNKLDNFFLKIPLLNRLSFKFVCVIR